MNCSAVNLLETPVPMDGWCAHSAVLKALVTYTDCTELLHAQHVHFSVPVEPPYCPHRLEFCLVWAEAVCQLLNSSPDKGRCLCGG